MKQIDPKISKMMSEFAKRRKHPFMAFKEDNELARSAGRKGAAKRWQNHVPNNQETTDPAPETEAVAES